VWECQELMGLIYSFDTTFHEKYRDVVEEVEMEEQYGDIMNLVRFDDDDDETTDDEDDREFNFLMNSLPPDEFQNEALFLHLTRGLTM